MKEKKELYTCPICKEDMEWKDLLAHKVIDCSRAPKEEPNSGPIVTKFIIPAGNSMFSSFGKIINPIPNDVEVTFREIYPSPYYAPSFSTFIGGTGTTLKIPTLPKIKAKWTTPYKPKLKIK